MKTYTIKYLLLIFFFMVSLLIPLPDALSQVYSPAFIPRIAPGNGIIIPIGPAGPLLPVLPLPGASFLFYQFPPLQIIGLSSRFGNSYGSNGVAIGIPSTSGGYGGMALQGNGIPASPYDPMGTPELMGGPQMQPVTGLMDQYRMMGGPGPTGYPGQMGGPVQMVGPDPMVGPGMVDNIMRPPIAGTVALPVATPPPTTIVASTTFPIPVIVDTIALPISNNVGPVPIVDTIPTPFIVNTLPLPVVNDVVPPPVVDALPPSLPPSVTNFPAPTISSPVVNRREYPMQYNYVNLGSFGVYAPTDPVNFALVNSFFPNGILTGPQTVVTDNVTTVTTPIVMSTSYYPNPTPGVVDLNSIQYAPASSLPLNNMIASPYVTIYGPGGLLLSGPGLF